MNKGGVLNSYDTAQNVSNHSTYSSEDFKKCGSHIGTVIGTWGCAILAFVSLFVGIMNDHVFIGCIVGMFFVFLGVKVFNDAPEEFRKEVYELQKQEEYKKMHGGYKCPSCGMMAGHEIGAVSKGVSIGMLGIASNKLGKTYKCENCKYMW